MKKLVAALFALSIPLSLVQAQTLTATGDYVGTVADRCFATSNILNGELAPEPVTGNSFVDTLTGSGDFTYRSNTPNCAISSVTPNVTDAPDGESETALTATSTCVPNTTDLDVATGEPGATISVVGTIEDEGDNVLIAGSYTLNCTANLTYPM